MNKIILVFALSFLSIATVSAQNSFASELIIVNGETFGNNQSNIASYNIATKTYEVFDSLFDNSVQDILIKDSVAYIASENKVFSYNLYTKTKIAEAFYPGISPAKGSLFLDENNLFVGNWYGQIDNNIYAFNKTTLGLEFSVNEATTECGGGLSLNDTLYIGQKIKGTIDACAPFGCFTDTMGAILVTDAATGTYYRTIDLGLSGAGISQIFNYGNSLFAVCTEANKILQIEIGTDSIIEEISLAPFTQILNVQDSKIYLDLNGTAGYFDMADNSFALSSLNISGAAATYDPTTEIAFTTSTDYFSYGKLQVYDATAGDTLEIGISPEAIALFYVANAAPIAVNDSFTFVYDNNTLSYTLNVLSNDSDPDGSLLALSNLSTTSVSGASVSIVSNQVLYTKSPGIATTDMFTYDACDDNGLCSTATAYVTLKSIVSIKELSSNFKVNIYPNPSSEFINIESEHDIIEVNIYTIAGQKVKFSKESIINLEGINKGIYFVAVKTKMGVNTQPITIQ